MIVCIWAHLSREAGVVIVRSFENTHLVPLRPPLPEEFTTIVCVSELPVGTGAKATELEIIREKVMNPHPLNQIITSGPLVILQARVDSSRNLLIRSAAYEIFIHTIVISAQKLKDVMQEITAAKKIKIPNEIPAAFQMNLDSSSGPYIISELHQSSVIIFHTVAKSFLSRTISNI